MRGILGRSVVVGAREATLLMRVPRAFVQHHLSSRLPRLENHLVGILDEVAVAFDLEFADDLIPPRVSHKPARTLHSHRLGDHHVLELFVALLPRGCGKFLLLAILHLNDELCEVNGRLIHPPPLHGVEEVAPRSDNLIVLDTVENDFIEALGERTMAVSTHQILTLGDSDPCVDSPAHSTILPKMKRFDAWVVNRCVPIPVIHVDDLHLTDSVVQDGLRSLVNQRVVITR